MFFNFLESVLIFGLFKLVFVILLCSLSVLIVVIIMIILIFVYKCGCLICKNFFIFKFVLNLVFVII